MRSDATAFELRVRFAETDQMGIAHHSAYVLWCEAARVEWLRERGLSYREMEDSGLSLAVAGIEIEYRAAARFDDLLVVHTRATEVKSRRVSFEYQIERPADGVRIATARSIHVPTGRDGRATRIGERWLAPLMKMVGGAP